MNGRLGPGSVARVPTRPGLLALTLFALFLLCSRMTLAQPADVVFDGRDEFTLLKRRLANRQLIEQLDSQQQSFRLARGFEQFAAAADVEVGTQQPPFGGQQSRFHGYFVFDGFASFRAVDGLDANLNLTTFNPSASDGYRVSSHINPGANLHFHHEHEFDEGRRLRFDLVATDLDQVTTGGGLLLEQTPLEGVFGNLEFCDWYLRYLFGGRVFWNDDDLETYSVGWSEGKVDLSFTRWSFADRGHSAFYTNVSSRWPLLNERLQLVGEVSVRLRQQDEEGEAAGVVVSETDAAEQARNSSNALPMAALLRADYMDQFGGLAWHVGYQFRWYEQRFGPSNGVEPPSVTFNLPYRQQTYVTNSFEYFGVSEFFDQWSHTVMLETEVPLGNYFKLVGHGEWIHHATRDPLSSDRLLRDAQGRAQPNAYGALWYWASLQLYPWPALPHRLSATLTNKQVRSWHSERAPVVERFQPGDYLLLSMEGAL